MSDSLLYPSRENVRGAGYFGGRGAGDRSFCFRGVALADLVVEKACKQGLGTSLPR